MADEELDGQAAEESGAGGRDEKDEFDEARAQVSGGELGEKNAENFGDSASDESQRATENSEEIVEKTVSRQSKESGQTILPKEEKLDPLRVIEAALFLSNKPLAYPELALVAKTSVRRAKELAEKLSAQYAEKEGAVELVCDAQQATMQVKPLFLGPVAQLSKNVEISRKGSKMLALVAKKGKLLQSELKKYFRGDIYAYIAELKELGYISSEKKGNTRLLKVTEKFRENFQLSGVELPPAPEPVSSAGEEKMAEAGQGAETGGEKTGIGEEQKEEAAKAEIVSQTAQEQVASSASQ